jgi:hypothetical protein
MRLKPCRQVAGGNHHTSANPHMPQRTVLVAQTAANRSLGHARLDRGVRDGQVAGNHARLPP